MKPCLTLLLLAFALAGCSTFEKRAEQKADVYSRLDAATQGKLKQGLVEIGYSPDMVYIALGSPDQRNETVTAQGRKEIWIYNSYYTEYRGSEHAGYRRYVDYNPVTKQYFVYYEPLRVDVYSSNIEERIRITFENARVTMIEQAK
ncbi:MAG: hypothetical protein HKUEN07_36350 [Rhodocyclaceae bacterium]|nr:MAG: hypothetical protein HKUEN07_36350 [Rhodocyclaceae bacterium]